MSDVRLALGLVALVAVAVAVLTVAAVPMRRAVVTASLRAAIQLAVVAAALRGAFSYPAATAGVVAIMFGVACLTAGRRLSALGRPLWPVAASCGAGAGFVIAAVVGVPILSRDVRTLVAVSGIVIGGCMTAATLSGRRLADGLHRRREEIEGWLALGATPREAVRDVARTSAVEALIPGLDQTRTVGMVTLPGAFVGALLGGADATQAARFQITVLVGLLCAQSITACLLMALLGAPAHLPADPDEHPVELSSARPVRTRPRAPS